MFAQFEVSSLSRYIKHCSKIRRHLYSLSRCLKDTCRCLICFLQIIQYSIASHSLILTTLRDNLPTLPKSVRKLPHRPTQRFYFHSYIPSDCYSRLAIMIPFIAKGHKHTVFHHNSDCNLRRESNSSDEFYTL